MGYTISKGVPPFRPTCVHACMHAENRKGSGRDWLTHPAWTRGAVHGEAALPFQADEKSGASTPKNAPLFSLLSR